MNEYETKGKDTYTQEEAFQSSLNYFNGDELAARVWVNKYALKDSYGNIFEKNPDDMHRRLAKEISRIENRYPNPLSEDTIFEVLRDFKYIVPQGGPMTGIGNEFQIASLSNCFVIGNEGPSDSYGGVMKIDQEQVQLMKRRGGVGHDLSHIRPKGSPVKNSALTSTGIVPFMERYSNSTREVAQDGRRGALMLSVSINHPDSESFIDAKMTEGKVTGANVSVKIDDEFMRAVINDEEYEQKNPGSGPGRPGKAPAGCRPGCEWGAGPVRSQPHRADGSPGGRFPGKIRRQPGDPGEEKEPGRPADPGFCESLYGDPVCPGRGIHGNGHHPAPEAGGYGQLQSGDGDHHPDSAADFRGPAVCPGNPQRGCGGQAAGTDHHHLHGNP